MLCFLGKDTPAAEEDDGDEATDAFHAAVAAATTSEPGRELGWDSAIIPPEAVAPRSDERPDWVRRGHGTRRGRRGE